MDNNKVKIKKVVHLLIFIIASNIIFFLLFFPEDKNTELAKPLFSLKKNHSLFQLQARLKTPFSPYMKASLTNPSHSFVIEGVTILDMKTQTDESDFKSREKVIISFEVPTNQIHKLKQIKEVLVYPPIKSAYLKLNRKNKYEVTY